MSFSINLQFTAWNFFSGFSSVQWKGVCSSSAAAICTVQLHCTEILIS